MIKDSSLPWKSQSVTYESSDNLTIGICPGTHAKIPASFINSVLKCYHGMWLNFGVTVLPDGPEEPFVL